jgi:hypothetical protein
MGASIDQFGKRLTERKYRMAITLQGAIEIYPASSIPERAVGLVNIARRGDAGQGLHAAARFLSA